MITAAGIWTAVLSLRAGAMPRRPCGRAGSPGARIATISIQDRPDGIKGRRVPDHREGIAEHTALSRQANIPGMTSARLLSVVETTRMCWNSAGNPFSE
jgi:hypothetical protein